MNDDDETTLAALTAALRDWVSERSGEDSDAPLETRLTAGDIERIVNEHGHDLHGLVLALNSWSTLAAWSESPTGIFASMQIDKILTAHAPEVLARVREERHRQTLTNLHRGIADAEAGRVRRDPAILDDLDALPGDEEDAQQADAGLGREEVDALRAAGVPSPEGVHARPVDDAVERLDAMRRTGLTVGAAAQLLGVPEAEVGERLRERRLFAVEAGGGEHRFPGWQFEGHGMVPGLDLVLHAVPAGWSPVTVERLLTEPSPRLILGGRPVSPVASLTEGNPPDVVVALVQGLEIGR